VSRRSLRLSDATAVVTGAAGGIGAALVRRLHAEGAFVFAVDVARDPLAALALELGSRCVPHVLDVTDAGGWERLAGEVSSTRGGAQILVNNAGITVLGLFVSHELADVDRMVDVNLKSVLYGCRAFVPQLCAAPRAHIVNVSSLAGRVAFPYQSIYSATKFAVRGFSEALHMELAPRGVGVTVVLPGAVATRLLESARSYDAAASRAMADLMLAHGVRPERLAERIVRAIEHDEAEVVVGWDARVALAATAIAPRLVSRTLELAARWRDRRSPSR
jgi:NADP-dependent 3-hydroxy acid dehydrogenase YdfG